MPATAAARVAHGGPEVGGVRLQDAAAAEVVAELAHQNARHVPAREVRAREQLGGALPEARRARVPLDALARFLLRVAGLDAHGVRAAVALRERGGRDAAQEEEVVGGGDEGGSGKHYGEQEVGLVGFGGSTVVVGVLKGFKMEQDVKHFQIF